MAGTTERMFLPDHVSDAQCLEEVLSCFPKKNPYAARGQPTEDSKKVIVEPIDTAHEAGMASRIQAAAFHLADRPDLIIMETTYPDGRIDYRLVHTIRDAKGEIRETRVINFTATGSRFGILKPKVGIKDAYIDSNHHQESVRDHKARCGIVDEMVEYLCFGDETGCSSVG